MSTDWKEQYADLSRFIAGNSEIVISPSEISIPQEFRDEFYGRFDSIRSAVVDQHYSKLPVNVEAICRHFIGIEKEIIPLLGIEKISMPVDLYAFLHTPKEGLARSIYGRLFDLLQQKTTMESFEQQCLNEMNASAADLYRLGYEWWAGLAVIKFLQPEKAFLVDLDEDYKPFLTELKDISFGRQAHHPTLRIPEFVIFSRRLDTYVAVKMAIAREVETYCAGFKPPVRPKKRTGDTSSALDSRVMLLSFMPSPEKIPIIADIYERTHTSPDLMIECMTWEDLGNPESIDLVRVRLRAIDPRMGVCVLVMDPSTEGEMPEWDQIRTVAVGFDETKLALVIP